MRCIGRHSRSARLGTRWAVGDRANVRCRPPRTDLLHYESANTIRRLELSRAVGAEHAALAYADLLDLSIEVWPYEVVAERVWQLRHNLTGYDAAYVALAETLSATFVTLDQRIARSPGLRCTVACPA